MNPCLQGAEVAELTGNGVNNGARTAAVPVAALEMECWFI